LTLTAVSEIVPQVVGRCSSIAAQVGKQARTEARKTCNIEMRECYGEPHQGLNPSSQRCIKRCEHFCRELNAGTSIAPSLLRSTD
jgi:hypothetical protein